MSKDLFFLMREQEIATSNVFPTKREIESNAKSFAKNLLDAGEMDKLDLFAQAERATQAISVIRDEIKASIPREKQTFYGIELVPVNGRQMIQYQEDPIYCELLKAVKDREELLKLAQKQEVIDLYGNTVPKVSVKFSSDSLQVKY